MCCRALAYSTSTALQTTSSQVCDGQLDPPIALPLVQACLFHDHLHEEPLLCSPLRCSLVLRVPVN